MKEEVAIIVDIGLSYLQDFAKEESAGGQKIDLDCGFTYKQMWVIWAVDQRSGFGHAMISCGSAANVIAIANKIEGTWQLLDEDWLPVKLNGGS